LGTLLETPDKGLQVVDPRLDPASEWIPGLVLQRKGRAEIVALAPDPYPHEDEGRHGQSHDPTHLRKNRNTLEVPSFFFCFLARVKKKATTTALRMNQNPLVRAVIKATRATSMRGATPRRDGPA
jgi:hypothetical protein